MAYTKFDDSLPIDRARSVVNHPPSGWAQETVLQNTDGDTPLITDGPMEALEAVLDQKFLVGGLD